jgi:hypothetical protein
MRVRKQDGLEPGQVAGPQCRFNQTPGAELGQAPTNPNSLLQGRVGQEPGTLKVEENGCVTQPGNGEPAFRPGLRPGALWGWGDLYAGHCTPLPEFFPLNARMTYAAERRVNCNAGVNESQFIARPHQVSAD